MWGRTGSRIQGAYVANGVIGFMWNAVQGGSFPFPHVQVVRLRESDRSLLNQVQIFNPNFAFQFPSVGVNARGYIAGTLIFGGGSLFPSCAAWIADDINGGVLAPLEPYVVINGTSGPSQNALGDYLAARPHSPTSNTWIGMCFALLGGGDTQHVHPHFVWFGRERDGTTPTLPTLTAG